ncbi:MAG TPA: hypothetical protein PKV27_08665 [Ilumatobacteraceae bacterium]|nr:hypothetical protein [Ilumatobacteraceae bacterium]
MLLWFLGTAIASVWFVFRDDRFDYRLLLVGVLLPDIIDLPFGQARWAHSLTVAVGLLVVVMLTTGRRPIRRLLLGLPIGMMLHLVFDGAFSSNEVFWWPFSGSWGNTAVPTVSRGWFNVVLEALGAALLWWAWRQFGLRDSTARRRFVTTGQLHSAT